VAKFEPAFRDADDELLDQVAAALWLNLSERTLERMRQQRKGPSFVRWGARCVRYRLSDLRAYRDANLVKCGG